MRTRSVLGRWLVVAGVTVALVSAIGIAKPPISQKAFNALPPQERRLALYDACRDLLKDKYFDARSLDTPEWQARFAKYRAKAAAAPDDAHVYLEVFNQLAAQFPDSPMEFEPPTGPPASPPARVSAEQAALEQRMNSRFASGTGAETVLIRRGKLMATIVGDVTKGSPAETDGFEPGLLVEAGSLSGDLDEVYYMGLVLPLNAAQLLEVERTAQFTVPGIDSRAQLDAYIKEHAVSVEVDVEARPPRVPFETRKLDGGITYARFDSFADAAVIDQVLVAIDAATRAGLIVDLRHNGGGRIDLMARVLGRLLGPDADVGTARSGKQISNMRSQKSVRAYEGPIVALIGPYSASAAEIAAAALLDNKRGKLIGRITKGAVLVSERYPLPDGGRVLIAARDYVRSGDRRIEGVGVEPDIRVVPTLEEIRAGRDPVLERALQELKPAK